MPPQRRVALPSRRFPNFHAFVVAATGHVFTIRAETNTVDRPVKRSIVSTHHTFETSRSKRQRSSTRSARSPGTWGLPSRHNYNYRTCRCNSGCRCCKIAQEVSTPYTVKKLEFKLLPAPVPAQRELAGARYGIPQTDRFVTASRSNDRTVGRKGHGIDAITA